LSSEVFALGHELILVLAAFVLFFDFGMRYVITYRFTDTRVQAVLFRKLPVCTIGYDRINEVSIDPYLKVLIGPALWVPDRLMGSFVAIRRRSGLAVLMTPDDPEKFVRELGLRVQEWTGEWPLVS
jgi:hypothetical protein